MKHLDLEEQEQLDRLKAFWKQFGNVISGVLILVFGSIAAYNGYQWWQRDKAAQASAMYDEVERSVQGGDPAKISRAFTDMKERFAGTTYAAQAGLLTAKALYDKGQATEAKAPLEWVATSAADESYRAIAKLRLSSLLFESKAYDDALKQLDGLPKEFEALAADRRGDILLAQGKRDEAKAAFEKAHKAMDERSEYRRLIEVKLNALGVDVSTKTAANTPATPDAAPVATPVAAPASAASK
ncbi:tetratricopeptide repeat protein [Variovorax sp. PCZ-1]|uniref:YfgM family protein n=1 Tax=Variovorax sp. PCZ-1 TaxID=2835533 RepID=UPI001BCD2D33|nr:tetratricopeptide repeat protein [Variovorax sp. PCZ-1]MBS7808507.1 tetratricopeptide repeat protein [Variovorax sp. PCZ-1]